MRKGFVAPETLPPVDRNRRWLLAWGLGYAAVGGASVLVPLYAIALDASLAFVGLIAATAALVGVPGAVAWAALAARTDRRRPFVLVALGATAGVLALVPLATTPAAVLALNAALFAYAVEFVGVTTGWPYGAFAYTADLGPTIGGVVPLALPLLYLPLVLDSYLLGLALLGRRAGSRLARIATGVAALLLVDLTLDPGAVAVGFWAYDAGGLYYGVPLSNYAGWLLSGTVAVLLVDLALDRTALRDRFAEAPYVLDDLVSFVVLWGGINLAVGNWLAVLVAAGLAVAVALANGVAGWVGTVADTRWASR